jgi:hypothetical protein
MIFDKNKWFGKYARFGLLALALVAVPMIHIQPVQAQCAGAWARAVATINDPAHGNHMIVLGAINSQDAFRRAKKCRVDASSAEYFIEGMRIVCAPYITCNTD